MSVSQTHIGSTKQVVALPFFAGNIPDASVTLTAFPAGTLWVNTPGYTMPANGSILGFSGALNEALTDGTLQAFPTIDGVAAGTWTTKQFAPETPRYVQHMQEGRKSGYTFLAGQRVGLGLHKDIGGGSVTPTTADGAFLLIVLLEGVNY